MKQVSVRNAVSVSTLTIAVNVWIQSSIVNSEPNASFGRCQRIEERKKLMGCSAVGGMGYGQGQVILVDSAVGKPEAVFH
jgi:hypothetical protein